MLVIALTDMKVNSSDSIYIPCFGIINNNHDEFSSVKQYLRFVYRFSINSSTSVTLYYTQSDFYATTDYSHIEPGTEINKDTVTVSSTLVEVTDSVTKIAY